MRITAKTDYAVRICAELAARYAISSASDTFVKAEELSSAQSVPVPFVLGILNELKQAGLIETRRGAVGGFRLALPPEQVVVADIVRAIDGPLANVAGRNVEDVHYLGAAVPVRDVWVALRASMRSVLDRVTLADIVAGQLAEPVRSLLADDAAWKTRPNRRNTRPSLTSEN